MKFLALAVTLAVILAPVAVAQQVGLSDLDFIGEVELGSGSATVVSVAAGHDYERPGGLVGLKLEGSRVAYETWKTSGVSTGAGPAVQAPSVDTAPSAAGDHVFRKLEIERLETAHTAHVVLRDGATVVMRGGQLEVHNRWEINCATTAGFVQDGLCAEYDSEFPDFSKAPLSGDLLRVATSAAGSISIVGSFSMDLIGMDLRDHDGRVIRSTSDESLGTYESYFSRIYVEQGRLTLSFSDDPAFAGVAAADGVVAGEGRVLVAGEAVINGERTGTGGPGYTGPFNVHLVPNGDGQLRLKDYHVETASTPTASSANFSPLWAFLLIIPALIAYGASKRSASMGDIEAALRSGKFTQAARLSGRVLRREPDHASAQLSRAIAFTKAGRPSKAVDGVRAFLASHEPRDGTLHYVMGLALSELGRDDEARNAMQVAVSRTPALASEVEMHLRPGRYEDAYA